MPDGTLMQWGEIWIPVNQTNIRLSFPIAFASASYGISSIGVYANTRDVSIVYSGQTTTTIDIYSSTTDRTFAQGARWIAIGRWK